MRAGSTSSTDSERWLEGRFGEGSRLFDRVFLSALVREAEDVEEFVCAGGAGGGWVVRARDDRLGLIGKVDVVFRTTVMYGRARWRSFFAMGGGQVLVR